MTAVDDLLLERLKPVSGGVELSLCASAVDASPVHRVVKESSLGIDLGGVGNDSLDNELSERASTSLGIQTGLGLSGRSGSHDLDPEVSMHNS